MRLQVFLSHSGVCSRREALKLVQSGRVKVNNDLVLEPSFNVNFSSDKVCLDGKLISLSERNYIKLNKPAGVVTTRKDRFAKQIIFDLLPARFKNLYPVGRLDKDTEGLLLLTNDGELAFRLTHPKFNIEKTYIALVAGCIDRQRKNKLESGIILSGIKTSPCKIEIISYDGNRSKVKISLAEGRKRQIREMFKKIGSFVIELKRIKEGPLELGDLSAGKWKELSHSEIEALYKETELKFND